MALVRVQSRGIRKRRRPRAGFTARKRRGPGPRAMMPYLRGGEVKFLDTTADNLTPPVTGVLVSSLNVIPQGVGESERLGRKVTLRALYIRCQFRISDADSAADGFRILRMLVYQDKQTNGAAPAVTDILQTAAFRSFRNLDNTGRFNILHDKYYTKNASSGLATALADTGMLIQTSNQLVMPIEYDATFDTGVISTIRSNNIGVLFISNIGAHFDVDFHSRIRYTDN